MQFVRQTEVAAFLASYPAPAEPASAWLTEIEHGQWAGYQALASDFLSADVSTPPEVVFNLAPSGVRLITLVDFKNQCGFADVNSEPFASSVRQPNPR